MASNALSGRFFAASGNVQVFGYGWSSSAASRARVFDLSR